MFDSGPWRHGRFDWPLIFAVTAVAVLIVVSSIWQLADAVASGQLDHLERWQTAISALIGFAGLIITTALGFYFAARQRREDARLARQSREHQAELDRNRDDWLRDQEASALAAALVAEIAEVADDVKRISAAVYKLNRDAADSPELKELVVQHRKFPIFAANAAKLGLLDPAIVEGVVYFYRASNIALTSTKYMAAENKAEDERKKTRANDAVQAAIKLVPLLTAVAGVDDVPLRKKYEWLCDSDPNSEPCGPSLDSDSATPGDSCKPDDD